MLNLRENRAVDGGSCPLRRTNPASRDVAEARGDSERLGKIRVRKQDLETRLADSERIGSQPVDLEATRDAQADLARFRDVLEGKGSLELRREFVRGFVREIAIDPDDGSETITFYELAETSFMMVPGARVARLKTLRSKRLDGFCLPEEAWTVAA